MTAITPTAKALVLGGGIAIGVVTDIFEMQNGIQAVDVLLGLQILVLGAVWQLRHEVSAFRGDLKSKPSHEQVAQKIREARLT